MAEYLIQDSTLTNIANAVRNKTGKTGSILVSNIANEISNISTGVELNFKVVGGTTAPSNPTENTIWVNTSTTISGWVFSPTEPTSPSPNSVWIYVSTNSPVRFNAVKNDAIELYPIDVKQYISGSWVAKTVKSWQNGKWIDWWDGSTIYEIGNDYQAITGGWGKVSPNSVIEGNFEITTSGMKVSATSSYGRHCYRTHYNEIDLTDYSAIECVAYGEPGRSCLVISNADGMQGSSVQITSTSPQTYRLDISSVTGKWYVGFGVWFSENGTFTMTMQKIKLIK